MTLSGQIPSHFLDSDIKLILNNISGLIKKSYETVNRLHVKHVMKNGSHCLQ